MNTSQSSVVQGWTIWGTGTSAMMVFGAAGILIVGALIGLFFRSRRRRLKTGLKIAADHYDIPALATKVQQLNGRPLTLLLAAGSISDLPVTVPVNLAIQLCQKGKCLLIDLDLRRDSVARVFDLPPNGPESGFHMSSLPSLIDNLYIWPARHFETLRQMNLHAILQEARKKYDFILLYAPYLTTLADRKQIAGCVGQALVFGKPHDKDDRLITLLQTHKCRIVPQ